MRAALIILDGWGLGPEGPGNCVRLAKTPVVDALDATRSRTTLITSGREVGLPVGQMGNSEVGHLTLGAGRVVPQDLVRIGDAVADRTFFDNPVLVAALAEAGRVHIMGLASDGGVHSELSHMLALGEAAHAAGRDFCFHAFTDGRDVAPTSGIGHVRTLLEAGPVASVCGRYYAMDRDRRWERTKRSYEAMVAGDCPHVDDVVAAMQASYDAGVTDEFVEPFSTGVAPIEDGDLIVFANFRADRARQLTEALTEPAFDGFTRSRVPQTGYVMMTRYREDFDLPVLYPRAIPEDVYAAVLARNERGDLRVAETEKYAHVTYFFNGGAEKPYPGEERILIPSPKVATYDLQPTMSAAEVARAGAEGIRSGRFHSLILNFANPDMVGHTGVIDAAVAACEAVDRALGELLAAIEECGWKALVTADHGNAECLIDPDSGGPHTAHTTNPVPCWLVGDDAAMRSGGTLGDVAPTLLAMLGLEQPALMTGRDLRAGN